MNAEPETLAAEGTAVEDGNAATLAIHERAANGNDLWEDLDESEYRQGLTARQDRLQQAVRDLEAAERTLAETVASLETADTEFRAAMEAFTDIELAGDQDALTAAWRNVRSTLEQWTHLKETADDQRAALEEAKDDREKSAIWLEKWKRDYEAQSDPFAVRDRIARCGSRYCSATGLLGDERFTVFQPHVLETVGAHHAYAQGLTGAGVRIGIEDDIVNYRLPEFAGRISYDGATLTYPVYDGDDFLSDASNCARASESRREVLGCKVITYSSPYPEIEALTARWAIANYGWPEDGEDWFLRNDHYEEGNLLRWSKLPAGASPSHSHGTRVASVAAGRDFGIAPGAMIIPIAKDFDTESQRDQADVERTLLWYIQSLPGKERREFDSRLAQGIEADYAHYDIINRSFGIGVFSPASISAVLDDETNWWGEGLRQILPETWRAYMQTGRDPEERTVVVYAVGNQTEEFGGLGANIPYYETHVRGHHLSVMAVDHDGSHANYTNFCGPLPSDWDSERWGRHYCLAAPGTVNTVSNQGSNWIYHETDGTSFAAPVVSGAIALLMERFRGQLGNSEIVRRVVNTADDTGRYSQLEIYGAGLLDLEAALQPVGPTSTGTPVTSASAASTVLHVPPAMGAVGSRLAASGVEVASLDSLGAPFWSSPARYVRTLAYQATAVPGFAEPDQESSGGPHLGFTPGTRAAGGGVNGLRLLMGNGRMGVERAPLEGFRWGFLGDVASWHGGHASGAFGDGVHSMTSWVGRNVRVELDDAWTVNASATVALGRAFFSPGSMLDADPYAMSTWNFNLERGERGRGSWSRVSLWQPLRAESGKATFTYLTGLENGAPAYGRTTVPLAPDGREVELAFTHERPIGWGRGIIEMAHSWDAGHEPRRTGSRIGAAYRVNW